MDDLHYVKDIDLAVAVGISLDFPEVVVLLAINCQPVTRYVGLLLLH